MLTPKLTVILIRHGPMEARSPFPATSPIPQLLRARLASCSPEPVTYYFTVTRLVVKTRLVVRRLTTQCANHSHQPLDHRTGSGRIASCTLSSDLAAWLRGAIPLSLVIQPNGDYVVFTNAQIWRTLPPSACARCCGRRWRHWIRKLQLLD